MKLGTLRLALAPRGEVAHRPIVGVACMLLGCLILTANDALIKRLVEDMSVGQTISLRGLIGFVMTVLLAQALGGLGRLRPRNVRNAGVLTAMLVANLFLFPMSLRHIPLAEAIMLAYLSPIVVAALSPWLLAEHVGWRRWSAVVVGLIGAALVIDPAGGTLHPAVALPLIVAVMVGLRDIFTRRWIRGESALALVAAANLCAFGLGLFTVPFGWYPPTAEEWLYIVLAASLFTAAQFLLVTSFRFAEAPVLACLKFSAIAWAAAFGWIFWGEALSAADWIGALLIAVSGVVISLRTRTGKDEDAPARQSTTF